MDVAAFFQCYKEPVATFHALTHFRRAYPKTTIVLLSDNGYNYSKMAQHFGAVYIHSTEDLGVATGPNKKSKTHDFFKLYLKRLAHALSHIKERYFMWLEDDVRVCRPYTEPFLGVISGDFINIITKKQFDSCPSVVRILGDTTADRFFTGHGGAIYETAPFLSLITDTELTHPLIHDWPMSEFGHSLDNDLFFCLLCFIKGFPVAPLSEHKEGHERDSAAVLHQRKEYYGAPISPEVAALFEQPAPPNKQVGLLTTDQSAAFMRLSDWTAFLSETRSPVFEVIQPPPNCTLSSVLERKKNCVIAINDPDTDFPPPRAPYSYATPAFDDVPYAEKVEMDVLEVLERNNLLLFKHAVSVSHPRVIPVPLGLFSKFSPTTIPTIKTILCYANFGIPCDRWFGNPRKDLLTQIASKPFITKENIVEDNGRRDTSDLTTFYSKIAASKFVLCPRGCGLDSYRLWDAMALGAIPIVEWMPSYEAWLDLPILFVGSAFFLHVTEAELESIYREFQAREFDYSRALGDFYKRELRNAITRYE